MEIKMPKLSDTMEEGKILRWLKAVGEAIQAGEVVAEVETDKADMEIEAESTGVLREIRVAEGESAAVGEVIAVLGEEAVARQAQEKAAPRREPAETPAAKARTAAGRSPEQRPVEDRAEPTRRSPGLKTLAGPMRVKPPTRPSSAAPASRRESGRVELSKMRQTIARRMAEAKREIPHFYVTAEIDMTDAVRAIESLRDRLEERITVTHVLLKALAAALDRHPRVNGVWDDGAVCLSESANIGVAVAVEDGLIVPVVHDCRRRSLREIAAETERLVRAAREGDFSGDDLKGGTFSVSNLGMLDIEEFSAVINPPQAAILAVGAIKDRPVVREGQIVARKTMRVTLSCDHRQVNGVEAGRFLQTLKDLLENPAALFLA